MGRPFSAVLDNDCHGNFWIVERGEAGEPGVLAIVQTVFVSLPDFRRPCLATNHDLRYIGWIRHRPFGLQTATARGGAHRPMDNPPHPLAGHFQMLFADANLALHSWCHGGSRGWPAVERLAYEPRLEYFAAIGERRGVQRKLERCRQEEALADRHVDRVAD